MEYQLYIQRVIVIWTKESRGMPGAELRNRCPQNFRLSNVECHALTNEGYILVIMREVDKFVPAHSIELYKQESKKELPAVTIRQPKNVTPVVKYEYNTYLVGAPDRSNRPAISCEVKPGELIRVKYNGRFSEPSNEWYYQLNVSNIVFANQVKPEMFMAKPDHVIEDMADLF
jgi:hypothetical protein